MITLKNDDSFSRALKRTQITTDAALLVLPRLISTSPMRFLANLNIPMAATVPITSRMIAFGRLHYRRILKRRIYVKMPKTLLRSRANRRTIVQWWHSRRWCRWRAYRWCFRSFFREELCPSSRWWGIRAWSWCCHSVVFRRNRRRSDVCELEKNLLGVHIGTKQLTANP